MADMHYSFHTYSRAKKFSKEEFYMKPEVIDLLEGFVLLDFEVIAPCPICGRIICRCLADYTPHYGVPPVTEIK